MLTKIKGATRQMKIAALAVMGALLASLTLVAPSHAAADATTGIDWTADLVTPALTSAKGAILAGVAILALIMAVMIGKRAIRSIAR